MNSTDTLHTAPARAKADSGRTAVALVLTILIWSASFPAIKAAFHYLSPGHIALLRFIVGSVALGIYAIATGMRPPHPKDWPRIGLLGLLGVTFYHGFLNYGLVTVTSGSASILVNSAPIFTAILASIFLRERLGPIGWIGFALCLSGVAIISYGEGEGFRLSRGALLLVASAISLSFNVILQKPLFSRYAPVQIASYSVWCGTLGLLVFAPGLREAVRGLPAGIIMDMVYLGVFPVGLVYVTWAYVLSRMPVARASSYLYALPVVTGIIAWVFLHEAPRPLSIPGAAAALAGVALVNRSARPRVSNSEGRNRCMNA